MKGRLLFFSMAVLCGVVTVNAQLIRKKGKAAQMKVGTENILKTRSVLAVERMQPAAAEEYTVYNGEVSEEPSYWYEYDAKGQIVSSSSIYTMSGEVDSFYVQKSSYDYSKGYPVLLDEYHYRESAITHEKTPFEYRQRTTMEGGVRTKLENENYDIIELDQAGRVTRAVEDVREFRMEDIYTWNGEIPSSWRNLYEEYGSGGEVLYKTEMNVTNIKEVYAAVPFNAYAIDLTESFGSGTWICNATGTVTEDGETFDLVLTGSVSEDKKTLTQTMKAGDILDDVITLTYTDDNGSYVLEDRDNSYGDLFILKETHVFNEMGDEVENSREEIGKEGVEYSSKEKMEWEYDEQGRPLSMKRYIADREGSLNLNSILKFTKWHDASSVSSAVADGEVLGATLYALDGVKVCDLSAEEIANVKRDVQKSGIYILVKKTTRGTVAEKLIINR